jgi:hypothetical protein
VRPDLAVFILLFDEVSLEALTDHSGAIDARLFPNFATFSLESVWFRQAVSNYGMTGWSVNSLLSGGFSTEAISDVTNPDRRNLLLELQRAGFDVNFYSRFLGCSDGPVHCIDYYAGGGAETTRRIVGSAASIYLPPLFMNRTMPSVLAYPKYIEGEMLSALGTGSLGQPGTATMFHTLISHSPYILTPAGNFVSTNNYGFWQQGADSAAAFERYQQQLQYLDRQFGAFRHGLEASGRWGKSVIVLTSDHGTCWTPVCRGRLTVTEVESSLSRIPMMIRVPSMPARISDVDYQHIDALPTIFDAIGIATPADLKIEGRSAFRAGEDHRKRWFFVAGGCADVGFPAQRTPLRFDCPAPTSRALPSIAGLD